MIQNAKYLQNLKHFHFYERFPADKKSPRISLIKNLFLRGKSLLHFQESSECFNQ